MNTCARETWVLCEQRHSCGWSSSWRPRKFLACHCPVMPFRTAVCGIQHCMHYVGGVSTYIFGVMQDVHNGFAVVVPLCNRFGFVRKLCVPGLVASALSAVVLNHERIAAFRTIALYIHTWVDFFCISVSSKCLCLNSGSLGTTDPLNQAPSV